MAARSALGALGDESSGSERHPDAAGSASVAPSSKRSARSGPGVPAPAKCTGSDVKCDLCLQKGASVKCLGFMFRSRCQRACRSARRGGAETIDEMMLTDTEHWRSVVSPGITDESRARDSVRRKKLEKAITAFKTFKTNERVTPKLELCLERYVRYIAFWEGTDRDVAEAEFKSILQEQAKKGITIYGKKNRRCIQVGDNSKVQSREGKEQTGDQTQQNPKGVKAGRAPSVSGRSTFDLATGAPIGFMKERKDLATSVKRALSEMSGPKAPCQVMSTLTQKLSQSDLEGLETDPAKLKKKGDELRHKVNRLADTVPSCRRPEPEKLSKEVEEVMGEIEELNNEVAEQSACIKMALGDHSNSARKEKMKARYARTKVAQHLVGGKIGNAHAQLIAAVAEEVLTSDACADGIYSRVQDAVKVNPSEFVGGAICKWMSDQPFVLEIQKSQDKEDMTRTVTSLVQSLKEPGHQNWMGCMTKVSREPACTDEFKTFFNVELLHLNDKGGVPWISVSRPWAWRFGPSQCPLPGVGSLIQATSDNMLMQLINAEVILKNGVSIADAKQYFETPQGAKDFEENGISLRVPNGDVVFVPYGWLAMPVCVPAVEAEKLKASAESTGSYWAMAVFSTKLAKALDEPCWKAIEKFNTDRLVRSASSSPQWQFRSEAFAKFCEEVSQK
ncbi:unnamed protein product [Prorocentrum cordatum]|uniref:Uncharacterized protein n=1 Tax=Prorocentrum cordatum TaxID=2364126 RepID=A0ABN9Q3T6_9DINO|nr:unnamed protein product [Polarella glacialis]